MKFYDSTPKTFFAEDKLRVWKAHQRAVEKDDRLNISEEFALKLDPIMPSK